MSLESVDSLAKKFESQADLQAYCDSQFRAIRQLEAVNKQLQAEVNHLKGLLASTTTLLDNKVELVDVPMEQVICEVQIAKLHRAALDRELTLEETKRFDLLVKNLSLIKESNAAMPADFTVLPSSISEAQLVQIAGTPEPVLEHD